MRQSSHKAALRRNGKGAPCAPLPLFDWANAMASENSATPLPRVVRIISHRFALSPSIARLVAEHAGFRMEANHG
jgi:hypothetical protein